MKSDFTHVGEIYWKSTCNQQEEIMESAIANTLKP